MVPKNGTEYVTNLHPYSRKYSDEGYTNEGLPARMTSYKDVVLYRLAETYLMCAEAYYHMEGGGSAKAKEYFNKTYTRAGNDQFTGSLKIQDILDEYARECHMEGVRWQLLKRLRMLDRVAIYGGDLPPCMISETKVSLICPVVSTTSIHPRCILDSTSE